MKKIAFIGAGSVVFTRSLVRDLMTFPAFQDATIALMDIDDEKLMYAAKSVEKIIGSGNYPAKVISTKSRIEALKDADGVVSTINIGDLDVWANDITIPKIEASSLYAGIMIDTNNFVNRTGVRTFEAAAFLRRCGADITLVRKMFRDDMESYRAKAEIISSAEVYLEKFAIARGENLHIESPTIIGAQAANELLDINEVKASFVLTEYNGKIYISARSIDEVNVQIIMERLGGGGLMNASGAQFNHTDMEEAVASLKQVINDMTEGGDI